MQLQASLTETPTAATASAMRIKLRILINCRVVSASKREDYLINSRERIIRIRISGFINLT